MTMHNIILTHTNHPHACTCNVGLTRITTHTQNTSRRIRMYTSCDLCTRMRTHSFSWQTVNCKAFKVTPNNRCAHKCSVESSSLQCSPTLCSEDQLFRLCVRELSTVADTHKYCTYMYHVWSPHVHALQIPRQGVHHHWLPIISCGGFISVGEGGGSVALPPFPQLTSWRWFPLKSWY